MLVAHNIRIESSLGVDLILSISYNTETECKNLNVHVLGVGPICRLDVDDQPHGDVSGSHKHELETDSCPDENLKRGVIDRSDLGGKSVQELLGELCRIGGISNLPEIETESNERG